MFKTSFKVLSLAASLLVTCAPLQAQQTASGTGATVGTFIPPGVIMPYAGSTAPAGWVLAYGQQVSQTGTYAKLFAAIGSTYCTADHGGTCTGGNFRLPDLRGRFLGGKDNMGGSAAGRITAAKTVDGTALAAAGGAQTNTPAGTNGPSNVPASGLGFGGTGVAMNTWSAAGSFQDTVSIPALSFSGSGTLAAHAHGLGASGYAKIHNEGTNWDASLFKNSWSIYTVKSTIPYSAASTHMLLWMPSNSYDIGALWVSATAGTEGFTFYGPQLGGGTEAVSGTPSQSVSGNTNTGSGTGTSTARSTWFAAGNYTPAGSVTGTATAAAQSFTGTEGNNLPPTVIVNYIIKI